MKTWVALNSTSKRTRVVVTLGGVVVLRGNLPPLGEVRHTRAVTTLLEALSLWLDERLCVALSAESPDDCFRFDLADEMGVGAPEFVQTRALDLGPEAQGTGVRVARE